MYLKETLNVTDLTKDYPMNIPVRFGQNCHSHSVGDVNFMQFFDIWATYGKRLAILIAHFEYHRAKKLFTLTF